ncbi:uncharacterized protein LOC124924388 [Impatiens glandulifera]|uniref:uncharacterized protein LOC124924388 n=1 Tax=Impatiens glandulifera TaxID=253017 RepID=UPI001FB082AC|nr:uncharacterized protein LOC124924388 [Impatiens glandulifera]
MDVSREREDIEREREVSVNYLWHDHPIQIRSISSSGGGGGNCFVCSEPVNGYNYRCSYCDFFLHISCLFFPLESLHPLHPQHPLSLQIIGSEETTPLHCNQCKLLCSRLAYRCIPCGFSLHLPCVSRRAFDLKIHKHPLSCFASPPNQSSSFICHICREPGYKFNLACLCCHFVIHLECASFPVTVPIGQHRHPLSLTSVSSVFDDESGEFYCDDCETSVNIIGCVYFCAEPDCEYMIHLGCLTTGPDPAEAKKETTIMKSKLHKGKIKYTGLSESRQDEDEKLISMRNSLRLIEINEEDPSSEMESGNGEIEINHFSHQQHPLILGYNKHDRERATCFGCLDRMKAAMAYTCNNINNCYYFRGLHKWCGDVPMQIRHPLHHEHSLSQLTRGAYRMHRCIACHNRLFPHYSSLYNCSLCNVNIHVMCASIPINLKSEIHDHPLHLCQKSPKSSSNQIWCIVCGFECQGAYFICESCEFVVDFSCALLPRKVNNECHVHPLTLTDVQANSDETEFICTACEKPRNGFSWVYHCADCEYSAHTNCILNEVPGTKMRPIDFDRHQHLLSLISSSYFPSSSSFD